MKFAELDRSKLRFKPLGQRSNRVWIERNHTGIDAEPDEMEAALEEQILGIAADIRRARREGKPVVLAFGAHTIKNGLAPLLIHLIEKGWITHLATNGAGVIHDWEFSYQGASSEDVRENVKRGEFGLWEETGFSINLALIVGAYRGLGYGASIGALVENEGLLVPDIGELMRCLNRATPDSEAATAEAAAAAADTLWAVRKYGIRPGFLNIPHPYKRYGLQAAAFRLGVPFTAHPMFGHDIIYTHPLNLGAAVGRTAQRDFLSFAHSISRIDGGVYLSVGSAVMSPMIFEKCMAMAQNLARQEGRIIENHKIYVVDLAPMDWDWKAGEPPPGDPAYYVRFCKTFSRMGGSMSYVQADNRNFLLHLGRSLEGA